MASNILSIGQSALNAAQIGIATTGHNIANAATPGYSRQVVIQEAVAGQDMGFGFVGRGTDVGQVKRMYSDFLGSQVQEAQTSQRSLNVYHTQIAQIDNLLSDPDAGLSPALQDYFTGLQQVAANPTSTSARQLLISAGDSLAARFNSLDGRMQQLRSGLNSQISGSINSINTAAAQLAKLNAAITTALSTSGGTAQPNDLYDQRDQIVDDLSKQIRTTLVRQDGGQYNVFIGNGIPLVVGNESYKLAAVGSKTDPSRLEPAFISTGGPVTLSPESVAGGELGGLIEFRSKSLDPAQSALGRVAVSVAHAFNDQHQLGVDLKGNRGGKLFSEVDPVVSWSSGNTGNGVMAGTIVDAKALVASDYQVRYDGSNYVVTRLSDGVAQTFGGLPQIVDGVQITLASGAPNANDEFLVQPTIHGATNFTALLTDTNAVAAAAPVRTSSAPANTGGAKMAGGTVDSSYFAAPLAAPLTLTFDSSTTTLSGFPGGSAVTVNAGGVATTYAPGASVPYTTGATISFDGMSISITGVPANGDTFKVEANTSGVGDNRNVLSLGLLQTTGSMNGGTDTLQGGYAQLVSMIGSKTHELDVTSTAQTALLSETRNNLQAVSGVNLDEEAANLLRYQQAYQAAGRVMQTAATVFEVLLKLG